MLCNFPFKVVENVCPSFDNMIKWDVSSISSEFMLWMSHNHVQPGSTSLVGILSSSANESMISQLVDRSSSKYVRLLVELCMILILEIKPITPAATRQVWETSTD